MPHVPLDLTFFAWGDTHFGYEQLAGPDDFRWGIIEQMNDLAGRPCREDIGGSVGEPAFAVHCGDMVDGGEAADLELAYWQYFSSRLKMPQYEVIGNHDLAPEFVGHFVSRHGATSYSFDTHGFHCVALSAEFDEAEVGRIRNDELAFLREDLESVAAGAPIVLFVHSRLDRLHNGEEVLEVLSGNRIALLVAGHHHRPDAFVLDGIPCIDVGHCRNHPIDAEWGRSFYVVRISDCAVTAVPWRWDLRDWERGRPQDEGTAGDLTLRAQF